jgi:two-component system CheB/CheR fusion protein
MTRYIKKISDAPICAINTGFVDYILPATEIPKQLVKWPHDGSTNNGKISTELRQIFALLHAQTGHDFSSYKLNTINRRIEKQMQSHKLESLSDYVILLQTKRLEIDNLFKDLLIGVTSFFRDADAFETLKKEILLKALKNKPDDYCFRVWIPGCSTGEEVYSIAMIIHECMEELDQFYRVQIFGTDIDTNSLETARIGAYPEIIANDITPERLKKFFSTDKAAYKIKKEIREMVVFGVQNITKDPPFTKLDLICCRNLLIYLNSNLQKKILPIFHYSLKPKGILFLGISETVTGFVNLFQPSVKKWKMYRRKDSEISVQALINFPSIPRVLSNNNIQVTDKMPLEENVDLNASTQDFLLDSHISLSTIEKPPQIKIEKTKATGSAIKGKKISQLEQELQDSRNNLQTTIEELESSNEELQSTNEEIETSKEELQSLNEELIIINTELQNRINQLATTNDDMNNLFNSTEIAAIFLDNALCVKRFTPKIQELIHLINTDIGRSITHFATNILYEKLLADAEEVIKTLVQKSIEVQSKDHRWYIIRILPYRTLANVIDGVVITFTDITLHKESEEKLNSLNASLQSALAYAENILETIREPLLVLDEELRIVTANSAFLNFFKTTDKESIGKYIYQLGNSQWDIPQLRELLSKVTDENIFFEDYEVDHKFPVIGRTKMVLNAKLMLQDPTNKKLILLAMERKH